HLSWARRILVVDTGSRDGTPERLRAAGAPLEVIDGDPSSLIEEARNLAIDRVEEGWILVLDLDERVPIPLREEILRATESHRSPSAYRIPLRHYVFGRWLRHGGWNDRHLRLFGAGRGRYPEACIHAQPRIDGEVGDLEQPIVHFAHPTLHDFLVKLNRYTSQAAPIIDTRGEGGLRKRPPLPEKPWRWLWSCLSVFWSRYIKAAGFRDGMAGFLVAALLAAYQFVEQAKVWERRHVAADGEIR
ncbi:MAG: glycosyltransferase family 2 protein, partial [Planctomycetota bacterium]